MSQYLTEVMSRVSVGGLSIFLIIVIVCLIISSIRSSKAKPKNSAVAAMPVCPTCGKELIS